MKPIKTFLVTPVLPHSIAALEELAYNYWWSWDEDGRELFERIDPVLWKSVKHNPVKLLATVPQERLHQLAESRDFLHLLSIVHKRFRDYITGETWYKSLARPYDEQIAYFCAEFGIHESFPNYSGGLGILAGDHLKSASDLGIPLVGIGLLYQMGYFHQTLSQNGWQNEMYSENVFSTLPLVRVTVPGSTEPLTVTVDLPNGAVYIHIWRLSVGRVTLYLLDTNIPENANPEYRDITDQLYGGNIETRIQQEIVLGIGGYRALEAMGIRPTVCHINEGHAAFMALERTRFVMQELNISFNHALEISRSGNVFTTHTPVPAGNEVFSIDLIEKYFSGYIKTLGLSTEQFYALGRQIQSDTNEQFSMTVLGLRTALHRNGVAQLHGVVSRNMWRNIWKDFPVDEVPIGAITNGIHSLSWVAEEIAELYDRYLGHEWRTETQNEELWQDVEMIPSLELWRTHERLRERMVIYARAHIQRRAPKYTAYDQLVRISDVLDPHALTIGFSRRFATYKRATLLFGDMARLKNLLESVNSPVQFVIAGKAHPKDNPGKEMIKTIVQQIKAHGLERNIVFLEDYDIETARFLVQGCDVWLNTPRRPLEASGTSGMKAAINGVLHLSTLDGWWDEAYNGMNGFSIGAGEEYENSDEHDAIEREALFQLLEQEIIPMFYDRSKKGIPERWVERMKECLKTLPAFFSTQRMVQEYSEVHYFVATQIVQALSAEHGKVAENLYNWKQNIRALWSHISVLRVDITGTENAYVGKPIHVSAEIDLAGISPSDVVVEAYYGILSASGEILNGRSAPLSVNRDASTESVIRYFGSFDCEHSGTLGCTIRIVPSHQLMTNKQDLYICKWA